MSCHRDDIKTVKEARRLTVAIGTDEEAYGEEALVSTTAIGGFRAVRTPVLVDGVKAIMSREAADALKLGEGEAVSVKA